MGTRQHCVSVRMSPDELARLDAARCGVRRGAYLRAAWLGRPLPRAIPDLNIEAWRALARSASNINQIAASLNAGDTANLADIRAELAAFRQSLLGAAL